MEQEVSKGTTKKNTQLDEESDKEINRIFMAITEWSLNYPLAKRKKRTSGTRQSFAEKDEREEIEESHILRTCQETTNKNFFKKTATVKFH